jgi:hypothetical protein
VIKYAILGQIFENGELLAKYITEGREDKFTSDYQITLEIHPKNLEIFLYFWWKIRGIRREEYRLWISNLNIYLVQHKPTG